MKPTASKVVNALLEADLDPADFLSKQVKSGFHTPVIKKTDEHTYEIEVGSQDRMIHGEATLNLHDQAVRKGFRTASLIVRFVRGSLERIRYEKDWYSKQGIVWIAPTSLSTFEFDMSNTVEVLGVDRLTTILRDWARSVFQDYVNRRFARGSKEHYIETRRGKDLFIQDTIKFIKKAAGSA
ncbi:MAG: hypothetical protein ACYSUV_02080 [Planctomycetota bacterium]|jgi:hypothetical protein